MNSLKTLMVINSMLTNRIVSIENALSGVWGVLLQRVSSLSFEMNNLGLCWFSHKLLPLLHICDAAGKRRLAHLNRIWNGNRFVQKFLSSDSCEVQLCHRHPFLVSFERVREAQTVIDSEIWLQALTTPKGGWSWGGRGLGWERVGVVAEVCE